jgi:pyridoxine kinase
MGEPAVGTAILDAVARVRRANPVAVYCCDPVIGDAVAGQYVRPGVAELLGARALPAADVATPNQFELRYLTGEPCASLRDVLAAAKALRRRIHAGGLRNVLVTSVRTDTTPGDSVDVIACGKEGCFLVRTPLLEVAANGAGDALAAIYLFHLHRGSGVRQALQASVSSVFGLLRRTAEAGSGELLTVAAQDEIVQPSRYFSAHPC